LTVLGEGERSHVDPHFLPDGLSVLFHVLDADYQTQVAAYSFDTDEWHTLLPFAATTPKFVPSGHLTFVREGELWAALFDARRLQLRGDPVRVGGINVLSAGTRAQYAVTSSGALVYRPDSGQRRLVWVDRSGNAEPLSAEPRQYEHPRVSRDGQRVLVQVGPLDNADIFVFDVQRDRFDRLTFDEGSSFFPIWGPTDDEVIFSSDRDGPISVYRQLADASGSAERLTDATRMQAALSLSPDGHTLLLQQTTGSSNNDIGAIRLDEPQEYRALVETDELETFAEVSPDGQWLAYHSLVSGQAEVYVRPFPDVNSGRWQISRDGGLSPVWAPDGSELFYRNSRTGEMMAVAIDTEPEFRAGTAAALFDGPYLMVTLSRFRPWDVAPDGRFLMVQEESRVESGQEIPDFVFVENWIEELKERIPAP
jgi:hypothetical protein